MELTEDLSGILEAGVRRDLHDPFQEQISRNTKEVLDLTFYDPLGSQFTFNSIIDVANGEKIDE